MAACRQAEEITTSGALQLAKIGKFESPVYAAGNGVTSGLYVVEQGGRIILVEQGQRQVFLDISDQVKFDGEQGLLSVAFSPNFAADRRFYLYYTNRQEQQVVAEGLSNLQGTAGRLSRELLVMDDFAGNHNGGQLLFGPGGLYIATGDGGGSGDPERTALDLNSLLGKILRIVPTVPGAGYTIPADNPFINRPGARPEIFSYGLRNPWRFTIAAGRLWIADVGQDEREEINAPLLSAARGASFGWSRYEGRQEFNSDQRRAAKTIFPVLEYEHQDGRCSVTGGVVVEAPGLPSLNGQYIYGDFCQGQLRAFRLDQGRVIDDRYLGLSVPGLVSFSTVGPELLVISNQGQIYRLAEK